MVNFHAISAFLRSDLGPSSFWAAGPRPNSLKTKEGLVVKVVQGQIAQQKVKHLCFFFHQFVGCFKLLLCRNTKVKHRFEYFAIQCLCDFQNIVKWEKTGAKK